GARSQAIGGLTWGIGQAPLEGSAMDPGSGRFVGKSLSADHRPGQADVPDIEGGFAGEVHPRASALGARGGGAVGTNRGGAAVAGEGVVPRHGHRGRRPADPGRAARRAPLGAQAVGFESFASSARPIVFTSVPNQIWLPFRSNTM